MRRLTLTLGLTAGLGLLLAGCETIPKPVKVDFAEARPAPLPMVAAPRPASGSLRFLCPGSETVREAASLGPTSA